MVEAEQAALARGLDRAAGNYKTAISRGVIEAVFEEMELKKRVFGDLDEGRSRARCSPPTLLRST